MLVLGDIPLSSQILLMTCRLFRQYHADNDTSHLTCGMYFLKRLIR